MPQQPKTRPGEQTNAPANLPQAASSSTDPMRVPTQGAGVEQKPFKYGAPPRYVKYNVAVKVLADPVARTTFSQPYSGQRRLWGI
jgi:hypothetical protein